MSCPMLANASCVLILLLSLGCRPNGTAPETTSLDSAALQPPPEATPTPTRWAELKVVAEENITREGDHIIKVDLRTLSGEALRAAIAEVASLDSLQEVLIAGDEVTDEWMLPLVDTQSLKRLRAPQTRITGKTIEALASTASLELLDLTDVKSFGVGDAASIAGLRRLKELNLMNTTVDDQVFAHVATLPQLRKVRLRGTAITGDNVGDLSQSSVSDIEISETGFGNTGMSSIANMPQLQKLNLWLTKIDDEGLAEIKDKTSLTLLNLDNVSGITDASLPIIVSLVNLELLHLGGTSVSSDSVSQLASLKKLKTLFITRLGVSDASAESLRRELPVVERLEH